MVYMYHSFLIHSFADGYLGCFHVLAMINSAVMNIGVHVSLSDLISFRIDWLDFLAVQGTLKSLLQHHSSKASMFLVLSFLYSPTLTSIHDHWKNHSLN